MKKAYSLRKYHQVVAIWVELYSDGSPLERVQLMRLLSTELKCQTIAAITLVWRSRIEPVERLVRDLFLKLSYNANEDDIAFTLRLLSGPTL